MLSAKRHNELVDFIMNESDGFETQKDLERALVTRFAEINI